MGSDPDGLIGMDQGLPGDASPTDGSRRPGGMQGAQNRRAQGLLQAHI